MLNINRCYRSRLRQLSITSQDDGGWLLFIPVGSRLVIFEGHYIFGNRSRRFVKPLDTYFNILMSSPELERRYF